MFDLSRVVQIVRGMVLEPRPTWQAYLAENKAWRQTLVELALPIIAGSLIAEFILSLLFGSISLTLGGLVFNLIAAVAGLFISVFLLALLAGVFGGRNDFDRAFAAVVLISIPTYIGVAIGVLPWLGWLLMFMATIYSLVLLYQVIPDALGVTQGKRVVHFVSFLISQVMTMILLSFFLLQLFAPLLLAD